MAGAGGATNGPRKALRNSVKRFALTVKRRCCPNLIPTVGSHYGWIVCNSRNRRLRLSGQSWNVVHRRFCNGRVSLSMTANAATAWEMIGARSVWHRNGDEHANGVESLSIARAEARLRFLEGSQSQRDSMASSTALISAIFVWRSAFDCNSARIRKAAWRYSGPSIGLSFRSAERSFTTSRTPAGRTAHGLQSLM